MFLWGNYRRVEELFEKFAEEVGQALSYSFDALKEYIDNGETDRALELSKYAHQAESTADDLRRDIINQLVKGSLMPNTRADMMNLLEFMDDVADESEDLLDHFIWLSLDLTEVDKHSMDNMMEKILEQYNLLAKAVKLLFSDMSDIVSLTNQIENIESQVDDIEEAMIRKLARREDIGLAEKLVYKDFLHKTSSLANIIENAANQLEVIVAVRSG